MINIKSFKTWNIDELEELERLKNRGEFNELIKRLNKNAL